MVICYVMDLFLSNAHSSDFFMVLIDWFGLLLLLLLASASHVSCIGIEIVSDTGTFTLTALLHCCIDCLLLLAAPCSSPC